MKRVYWAAAASAIVIAVAVLSALVVALPQQCTIPAPALANASTGVAIGAAYYGVTLSASSHICPENATVLRTAQVSGLAQISSMKIRSPANASPIGINGTTLQLNAMAIAHYNGRNYTYWLQNVADFISTNTVNGTVKRNLTELAFGSDVLNATSQYANVTPQSIVGNGGVYFDPNTNTSYYGYITNPTEYSLPKNITLGITVYTNEQYPVIAFSNGTRIFDNVTLYVPTKNISIVIDPYIRASGFLYYDEELVFGGICCRLPASFIGLNATLSLYYYNGTGLSQPYPLYTYGFDTGETADNITSAYSPLTGDVRVTTGWMAP